MLLRTRVHTRAPVDAVWALVGHPLRWPEADLSALRVEGAAGPAAAGMRLVAVSRVGGLRIPVDVREVTRGTHLGVSIYLLPGAVEHRDVFVVPAARGGCDLTVSSRVEGPLARAVAGPVLLAGVALARVLSWRAQRLGTAAGPLSRHAG